MKDNCCAERVTAREPRRLVPLAPRLRLLALRHRRQHADEQPAGPGPLARHRRGSAAHHVRRCTPPPDRTLACSAYNASGQFSSCARAGKVEIGAFRTYPADYKPPDAAASEYQSIPLNKIEDFGVHAAMYYPLEVAIFKTSLDGRLIDLLWNKYWVNTLAASPLLSNKAFVAGQLDDVSACFCT